MRNSRTGYLLALGAAAISGVSIYINSFGVRALPDATLYTTLKNAVAGAVLLVPVVAFAHRRAELARLTAREVAWLAALAVIGGSVPYVLFFRGLQLTTAGTGSLLNHAQFLVVAALAIPLLRERISGLAWAGLLLLAAGSLAGTDLGTVRLNSGALLVLASTLLFGAGVVLSRHLLARLSPELVMAAKMSAGAVLLIAYSAGTGALAGVPALTAEQWGFAAGTGLILVAFTAATTFALRHAPALAVTSIGMASPPVTIALQAMAGQAPRLSPGAASSALLLAAGAGLFLLARRAPHAEAALQ